MLPGKSDKKSNGKKGFKSFHKKNAKPRSLEDLKKKITGKGFKPKGDGNGKRTFDKNKVKKNKDEVVAPLSKNAAKAAAQPNYSHKPYSRLVEQMKVHWNKLREHSTPEEVKANIVKEMLKAMNQHVMDITLRHDASRIVQAIIQFGSIAQQDLIISEIQAKMGEVAKTPYGHFVVLKAMNCCNQKPQMKKIAQAFQGSFVSLGTHVIGARVVETILQLYPTPIARGLKAEFYGKKFTILMPEPPKNLHELIVALPHKTAAILDHMRDLALKLIQKNLITFVYAHHLLWEYVQELMTMETAKAASTTLVSEEGAAVNSNNKGGNRINELVNALAEAGPKLLSTKPGAKVMAFIVTNSSAKDRKRIIKSLKGHVLESLVHESAYLGIIRLIDVVDDTVNVHKSFFDEFKATDRTVQYAANGDIVGYKDPAWLQICLHHNAHKLVLRLLTPNQRHLETDESQVLDIKSPFSKKDDDLRRKEHIVYIKPMLLKVVSMYASDLVRSRYGSKVLQAIYETFAPPSLIESLANVFADQFVENSGVNDSRDKDTSNSMDEDDSDDEDSEQDEDGDDEEDDDEEDEDAIPDEFDAEDDEENEEAGVENDEEYQNLLAEAQEDKNKSSKSSSGASNNNSQSNKKELLPIEEDPCAHILLKKLLQFETSFILENVRDQHDTNKGLRILRQYQVEDTAQHKHVASSSSPTTFSNQLEVSVSGLGLSPLGLGQRLMSLFEQHPDVFQRYLHCNRGCFALHTLFQVPALFADMVSLMKALAGDNWQGVSDADAREGGKLLLIKLFAASTNIHIVEPAKVVSKTAEKKGKKAASAIEPPQVEVAEVAEIKHEEIAAPTSTTKRPRGRAAVAAATTSSTATATPAAAEVSPAVAEPRVTRLGKRSRANTEDSTELYFKADDATVSDNESVGSSTSAPRRSSRRASAATATTTVEPASTTKRTRLTAVVEAKEEEEADEEETTTKKRTRKSTAASSLSADTKKTPSKKGSAKEEEVDEEDEEQNATKRRATRGRKSTSAK